MPICKLQQIWCCDTVVDSLTGDVLRCDMRVLVVVLCLLSLVDIRVLRHQPQLSQDKVILCESDSDKQHTSSVLLSVAVSETVLNVVVAVSGYLIAVQCPDSSVSMQDKAQFLDCVL